MMILGAVWDARVGLKEMKIRSPDILILGHVNINSIRNEFNHLKDIIVNNINILLVSETKLDDSFASVQFEMSG